MKILSLFNLIALNTFERQFNVPDSVIHSSEIGDEIGLAAKRTKGSPFAFCGITELSDPKLNSAVDFFSNPMFRFRSSNPELNKVLDELDEYKKTGVMGPTIKPPVVPPKPPVKKPENNETEIKPTAFKQLCTFIGIAIIIGFIIGQTFPNIKFYLMKPNQPKREITEKLFNSYDEGGSGEYAHLVLRERKFNYENAIIYGTLAFGISLFINSIRNNIKLKKGKESSIKMKE